MTFTCASCNGTFTEAIPKTAHDYEEKTVPPTCTESGYTQYTCRACGESHTDTDSSPTGHSWGTWLMTQVPTYTQTGEYMRTCSLCGEEGTKELRCLTETSESVRQEILRLVNIEREKAGVAPLSYQSSAQIVVDARVQDLLLKFSHTRPDGSSCFDALGVYEVSVGYPIGENIAMGYTSAASVMEGWMNSPGHRANILNPNFRYIAVGGVDSRWVQMFFG